MFNNIDLDKLAEEIAKGGVYMIKTVIALLENNLD